MIVILKQKTPEQEVKKLIDKIHSLGVDVQMINGQEKNILGIIGDTSKVDPSKIEANKNVEKIMSVQEPYKKANRLFHPENSIFNISGREIGGKKLALIAGPCSVEIGRAHV